MEMGYFTSATLNWFDDGCCDVKFLDIWSDAPCSHTPGQATGAGWHTDHYETVLTHDCNGRLFQKAADLLMRYQFYPPTALSHFGDFDLGPGRWMDVGDRIVQRIHVARLFHQPILDIIGITEVRQIISEPRCYGFTTVSVAPHVEQGEWSARITWRDEDHLMLAVDAISRPAPEEPARNHVFMRALQKKAHRLGMAHFKQLLMA